MVIARTWRRRSCASSELRRSGWAHGTLYSGNRPCISEEMFLGAMVEPRASLGECGEERVRSSYVRGQRLLSRPDQNASCVTTRKSSMGIPSNLPASCSRVITSLSSVDAVVSPEG